MKSFYLRKNIGGLIFTDPTKIPKGYKGFFSVEAWVDAKAPDNSLIYDDPTSLTVVGIPIVDGHCVAGMWHYHRRGDIVVPAQSKIRFKHFTYFSKIVKTTDIENGEKKPIRFDSMYSYDINNLKCAPKNVGTNVKVW